MPQIARTLIHRIVGCPLWVMLRSAEGRLHICTISCVTFRFVHLWVRLRGGGDGARLLVSSYPRVSSYAWGPKSLKHARKVIELVWIYIEPIMNQPGYQTVYTSPTRWIKTHCVTAPGITPRRPNIFDSQYFNIYPFFNLHLYYVHNFNWNMFNCDGDTANHIVHLYPCNNNNNNNNNIALKMPV
jgi:hypothetical protein